MSDVFDEFHARPRTPNEAKRTERARLRRRRRITTALITFILVIFLSAAAVVVISKLSGVEKHVSDYEGTGTGTVQITIPESATGTEMARILTEEGVIASEKPFITAFTEDPRSTGIQPGVYNLRKEMSSNAALLALLDPANLASVRVTIPEAWTKSQVAARLVNLMEYSEADVEAAMADTQALGLPKVAGGNVEGWLAPATYSFAPDTTPREALAQMVSKQIDTLKQLKVPEDQWEEVLTKASIVEREAIAQSDYAKVARVIENRLVDHTGEVLGRLQMDSTVLYGVGKTGGIPTSADLANDNPYNTYKNEGLPPSPIGVPRPEAITAVMHPEPGDWLYFTTVNLETGETKFTASYEEQQQFKAELDAWIKEHPDYLKK
ncbi:UPF0755 protein [Actinobaculum suis]|uniref:Endolytic murein transglycosylase n=1 Tax=Actinobaculum suis TaxID=1657 RepID=A0A0K9EU21_9ACTO|nr:endolytic transglycosylase MltG [Actinobaculum suis]KMY23699.1 hypothetical protein ACU19_02765 [Actinobaculum suis]MDY5153143.1 endolytic transglycosylase MltG [Actinobaculum suis]OCA93786.1 hypothetical protein ACU20_08090 [Actinobaculum suis]OCA94079.1 hypothetical protein ACU21_08045 [Actinobaculum suis]SDE33753.1 UPF0755 protein [Actinobaculum suis]